LRCIRRQAAVICSCVCYNATLFCHLSSRRSFALASKRTDRVGHCLLTLIIFLSGRTTDILILAWDYLT
jgi:hypothetical protein